MLFVLYMAHPFHLAKALGSGGNDWHGHQCCRRFLEFLMRFLRTFPPDLEIGMLLCPKYPFTIVFVKAQEVSHYGVQMVVNGVNRTGGGGSWSSSLTYTGSCESNLEVEICFGLSQKHL